MYEVLKKIRFLLIFLFLYSSSLFANEIKIISEDYKPLSYLKNGSLEGPNVEVIKLILKKLNLKNKIFVYPWRRGYLMTKQEPNTALFSTTRTPEREKLFKWVGPLSQKKFNIYALKKSQIKINTLEDLNKYKIGVERETINEQMLRSRNINNLSRVNYPSQNLGMLLKNRIQLWSISSSTFHETLKENNINEDKFESVFLLNQAKLYIAFNLNTSDDIINAWQNAYDELYLSRKVEEIFKRYNLSHLYYKQ